MVNGDKFTGSWKEKNRVAYNHFSDKSISNFYFKGLTFSQMLNYSKLSRIITRNLKNFKFRKMKDTTKIVFKVLIFLVSLLGSLQLSMAQSQIEMLIEGRKFVNSQTGLVFRYGYISSLNTYGVTISNPNLSGVNYINCSKNVATDESYMILTGCFDPNTGSGGFSRAIVGSRRAILSYSDGQLEFEIVD